MNCPKCGFSQPKDRYCASCGIDMETYRPAPPPLWKQLLVNPAFLIALTFGIVMGSVGYIRMKQREEVASRAALLKSGPIIVEQGRETPSPESASNASMEGPPADSARAAVSEPPPPPPAPTVAADATASSSAPAAAGGAAATVVPTSKSLASASPETKTSDAKAEKKIVVNAYYTEVDKQALAQLIEEAQAGGQFTDFGDFKSGAIAGVADRLGTAQGVKVLQKVSKSFDSKSFQQQWFVGNRSANEEDVGLTTLVVIEPSSDNHIRGEVEILRSLHEGAEGVIKKSYPISGFDLSPKWGWMVSLTLPRVEQFPDEEIGQEGLLRLFKSSRFKNGDTEFTLFLDFDSRSP